MLPAAEKLFDEVYQDCLDGKPSTVKDCNGYSKEELRSFLNILDYLDANGLIDYVEIKRNVYRIKITVEGINYKNPLSPSVNSPSINYNIHNVNAPSNIGNQTNPVINVGITLDDIRKMISDLPEEDQVALEGLPEALASIENGDTPVRKKILSKFSSGLKNHSPLIIAVGNWCMKLLFGI